MMRYCPKCQKDETRDECKYGEKYWDMYSLPMSLGKKYTPNTPHPGNMPEGYDHEYSMARSELSTIISAAKRLRKKMKGEGNIEAWVQSKITKAADYISSVRDYLQFEDDYDYEDAGSEYDDEEYDDEDEMEVEDYLASMTSEDFEVAPELKEIFEEIDGLKKKAEKSGISYSILKQVYNRGMAAWQTGHRPGTTAQQWAFARVNSFITKGKGTWGGYLS